VRNFSQIRHPLEGSAQNQEVLLIKVDQYILLAKFATELL
jgi:hypothetical protein